MIFTAAIQSRLNAGCPMLAGTAVGTKLASLESTIAVGFGGSKFYLDPVNGNDLRDGLSPLQAVKTLAVGYGKLTTNKNDILFVIGGASALSQATTFVWAKNYTHMIGLTAALMSNGMAQITASADHTPVFNITGSGCQFANIRWIHDQDDAGNLVGVSIAGDNNSFYNCHLEGPGHATIAGVAYRTLSLAIGAISNTFINCSIGSAGFLSGVATGVEIEILGTISDTHFIDCRIIGFCSDLGHVMVKANVSFGAEGSTVEFTRTKFYNMDNDKIQTAAINPPSTGNIILDNCSGVRIAAWSSVLTRVLVIDSSTI